MNRAVKNFVSYLMITMLFILNLLPMMNAFAQEVTSDAENTIEKDGLKVTGKIEDTSSQEDIKTVTYEITNTRDVPIKNLILKQKNNNDSPIKFVLDTLSEERGPTSLEEQAKVETNEKDQTTDIKLLNLHPGQRFGYNNTGFSNYADVTSILQGDKSATGSYTLADIPMTSSLNGQYQYYNFSGWSLFVVTKDQASKSRAFSIYYGARGNAAGTNNEFTMSNFLTAKQGNLDPIVTWFTVQGDKYWTGDNAQIKNSAGTWVNISNTLNPVNNAMNATVTDNDEHMVDKYPGKFAPDHPNFLDIDIDRMAIPEGVLNAGQNQINFRTTSSGDDYSTNAIGFAVNAETPEFEIKKEIEEPKETYKVGETITYRVSLKNTKADSEAINSVSKDALDGRLNYLPGSLKIISGPNSGEKTDASGDDQAEYDETNKQIIVRVGNGATATQGGSYKADTAETIYEFKAQINERAKANELVPNSATIKAVDILTSAKVNETSNIVEAKIADEQVTGKLTATKTVNNAKPKLGEAIEYTISFRNTIENSVLNKVVITDQLPKGLTYVKDSLTSVGDEPKPTSLTEANGTITAEYPSITDTKERSIRFKVIVNEEAKAGETILNKAKVDDTVNPPEEPEVPITPEEPITPRVKEGKLAATKTVNNAKPKLGEAIEYTISFRNTIENGVLNKVVITDQLPKGLTYVKDSLTSVGDEPKPTSLKEANGTITAEYPSLTDTKERSIRFKVIVNEEAKAGETILNKAKVDDTVNPPEEPEVPVVPETNAGKLTATKTVNNAKPKLGETIEYTISFRNTIENGVLNKVVITDQLPKGLTYVKDSLTSVGDEPKPTSLKEANGTITAEYPSITDTKERSIRFKVIVNEKAKAGETILNKAKVDDTVNPPEEPEVPITPEEPITPRIKEGKLTATKTVNNAKPKLGEAIEYTISFRNTIENGVLNKVVITDQLPKGLTYVKDSLTSVGDEPKPTSLTEANGTITAEYPSITDMKERSIRFKVIVNEEAKAGETILNKAKVDDTVNPPEEPEVPITPEEPAKNKKETKKVVTDQNKPTKNSKNEIAINKKETSKSSYLPKTGEKVQKIFAYLGVGLILIVLILYVIKRNKEKEE
ncbi:isopeptide-forming domain-containing fimbrial protein [Enterococcus faecalis]